MRSKAKMLNLPINIKKSVFAVVTIFQSLRFSLELNVRENIVIHRNIRFIDV